MGIKLGNLDISYFKVGGNDCSIYLGNTLLYPLQYKWIATYSGGTTSSAQCDGTSAITQGEIALSGLTDVEVFDCVSELGESAFSGCTTLRSINIPSASTSIARETFRGCENLSAITIPDSVTSIGEYAFIGCWNISSLNIPSGVTSIGRYAFMDCASVPSFTIPSGVTSINESVFWNCDSLTNIDIPDSVTSIGERAFGHCDNLSSVTIGNGVTSIDSEAFGECISLLSVTIPSGVTSIGRGAFEFCNSLTSVTVNATTPPELGSIAFDDTNDCPIFVPASSVDAYKTAWSRYADRIVPSNAKFYAKYSDSSTYTAECDFDERLLSATTKPSGYVASAMTSAEIGSCITSIGEGAFRDCSGLTRVNSSVDGVFNIPSGITTIQDSALRSCVSATTINLPNTVTSIGESAFRYCISLTSITIPDSVTSISNDTFNGCRNLSSIVIHDGVTSIGNSAFTSCSAATSISIGSGVTSIGQFAFGRITGVTNVIIPSGVTSIGQTAFRYCTNLSSVTVYATTPPVLGANAFANTNECPIYVPCESANAYKSASGWSDYASRIQGINCSLPSGYTEVEYVQNNTQGAYLNLGVKLYETIGNSYQITARYKSQYMSNWSSGQYMQTIINSEGVSTPYYGMAFRYAYNTHVLELGGVDKSDITWTNTDNGDGTSALTISSNNTAHADQVPLGLFASYQGNYRTPYRWSNATIYSMRITLNNELVRNLVPCKRDNDSMVGMYDLVNDVFYYPPNYQSYQLVAGPIV